MMQLLCNGVKLDLYEDAGLQFTHSNPLYAFDNLKCERTTEFKLPRTQTNDQVFSLARIPAFNGVGMRRKFSAQLQAGAVVKDGYLYIGSYDGKDYNAIFVTGELVGLQVIKDAGKINEILSFDNVITWDDSNPTKANATTLPNVGIVQYLHDTAHMNPSLSLKWLIQQVAAKVGVNIDFTNTSAIDRIRLFMNTKEYNVDAFDAVLTFSEGRPMGTILTPTLGIGSYSNHYASTWKAESEDNQGFGYDWDTMTAQRMLHVQFKQVVFPYAVTLTFDENTRESLCLISGDICDAATDINDNELGITFLDEHKFHRDDNDVLVYTGRPLAGRKVTIPANTPFVLIDGDGTHYRKPTALEDEDDALGFTFDRGGEAYRVNFTIEIEHKFEYGENVPYNAILPELTFIELLKMCAYLTGTQLNYENGQVRFETLTSWESTKEVKQLTKRGELTRTFADYARRNVIHFDSAEWLFTSEHLSRTYVVDNDNIEQEKELAKIEASEGGRQYANVDGVAYWRVYIRENEDKVTIADSLTNDEYMQRVTLPANDGITQLCSMSTQIKIETRMTLLEYTSITAKTLLWVDGLLYSWTERSWQKDVAKFTLARK